MQGNFADMMKQVQALQGNMQKAQESIADLEVLGESGGGIVKVAMTGKHRVKRIDVDGSVIGDDKDMLLDLITAAVNDAVGKAETAVQEKMGEVTSGLGLPAGFKMPF